MAVAWDNWELAGPEDDRCYRRCLSPECTATIYFMDGTGWRIEFEVASPVGVAATWSVRLDHHPAYPEEGMLMVELFAASLQVVD